MQDMKMRDQFAGMENAGKVSMESQSVKKCLKDRLTEADCCG